MYIFINKTPVDVHSHEAFEKVPEHLGEDSSCLNSDVESINAPI